MYRRRFASTQTAQMHLVVHLIRVQASDFHQQAMLNRGTIGCVAA
jgi:hypothetical protein